MTTIDALPCGTIQVRVCEGNACAIAWIGVADSPALKARELQTMLDTHALRPSLVSRSRGR